MPNPADRHPAESARFGQTARAPVGLATRRAFQRLHPNSLDLVVADPAWRSGARLVIEAFQTSLQKAPAPLAHHAQGAAQLFGDGLVVESLGTGQHHTSAPG